MLYEYKVQLLFKYLNNLKMHEYMYMSGENQENILDKKIKMK